MSYFRLAVGIIVTGVGASGLTGWLQPPVAWAVILVGLTILTHLAIDAAWDGWEGSGAAAATDTLQALRGFAATFLTTTGVVLALLAGFEAQKGVSVSIKVASVSLAGAIILSLILSARLVGGAPAKPRTATLMVVIFSLSFWLVVFGLLNLTFALVYS